MLFRKSAKTFLNQEVGSQDEEPVHKLATPYTPPTLEETFSFSSDDTIASQTSEPEEVPDVYLGPNTTFTGELEFPKLLRIDGKFEGKIRSSGRLILGPEGSIKANLNLTEAFISGKVEGDIQVQERLVLRGRAEIYGNITAPIVSVDEGVTIVGQLYVSKNATTASTASSSFIHDDDD